MTQAQSVYLPESLSVCTHTACPSLVERNDQAHENQGCHPLIHLNKIPRHMSGKLTS